jgi:cell division protein FtsL
MRNRVYLMLIAVLVSALAVVQLRHETRQRYAALQQLQGQRDALNVEWGQLLLEEGAWSQHRRVETLARSQLGMNLPEPKHVAVVRLAGEEAP